MKSCIIILIISVLISQEIICQTKAKVTDVDFRLENNQILVSYKLSGYSPLRIITIGLKFINENNQEIIPKTITGDIGTNITGDGTKSIIWDVAADQLEISGVLKAVVSVSEAIIPFKGPSNALLSVIVPGLGGYFVDKNKTRAAVTTLSTLGLITYGIIQKTHANKYYSDYKNSQNSDEIQALYNKANSYNHSYYISTSVGAAIWIADIVWVTLKGVKNKKAALTGKKAVSNNGLKLNYLNNGLQVGYQVTF